MLQNRLTKFGGWVAFVETYGVVYMQENCKPMAINNFFVEWGPGIP